MIHSTPACIFKAVEWRRYTSKSDSRRLPTGCFNVLDCGLSPERYEFLAARRLCWTLRCGTGRFSKALLNWGFHVTCADISHEMIEVAKSRLHGADGRLQFSRASADALPFCNEAFDAVVSMRFLPHIATQQRRIMLGEMARVSRRWVVFSNTYSNRWYEYRRGLKRRVGHVPPTRYPVTEKELHEELRSAGLRETGRCWTWRFLSEEVLVVCEKLSEGDRKLR